MLHGLQVLALCAEAARRVVAGSLRFHLSEPGLGLLQIPLMIVVDAEGEAQNRGYISCVTCHDVHRWETEAKRSGTGRPQDVDLKNSFLKVRSTFSIDRSFCNECHKDNSLELYQQYHSPAEEKKSN